MARVDQRLGYMLSKIAKPHKPFNDTLVYDLHSSQKIKAIAEVCIECGYDVIVDERYGIIVGNKFNKKLTNKKAIKNKLTHTNLIVMSHIDNIKKFNKQDIQENLVHQMLDIKGYEDYDLKISGGLDNTITNAIALSIMEMRKKNFGEDCDDVMFYFSIGEEHSSERGFIEHGGAWQFMDHFHKVILENDIKVINLDVSAQEYHGFENDEEVFAIIEYDAHLKDEKLGKNKKYSMLKSFAFFNYLYFSESLIYCDYGKIGTCDDLEEVTKHGIWGVTVGLNTYEKIHSKKNYTYVKHLDKYFNFLHNVILFLREKN